ncbi:MAG: N-acetylmuramoyl-L-alanine amidase CwlD [Lachnospiraceae bacterium]
MAILMIVAVYCTFRYKVLYSPASAGEKSRVVVIDPGHGGEDPGKVGVDGTLEKDVNLKIAKRLQTILEEKGYTVVLTRQQDEGLYSATDSNKKVADMRKRCSIIEEAKADAVVSIHQNSFSQEKVHGAQVFYYKYSTEGMNLAQCIQQKIQETVDESNTRSIKDNTTYYMLKHTPCPTVIVECGFLSNYEESKLLCDEDYQQKMAEAIMLGVEQYFNKE